MTRIGRMYLTLPLYKAFVATPDGPGLCRSGLRHAKPGYHPMTQRAVEGIIKKAKKQQAQKSASSSVRADGNSRT